MPEKISVDHLYKIFGGDAEETIGLLEQGRSKDEILQETGATVGVQDTSFAVEEGEIFVVMGLSGSGKSTLVRMLNRLIDPTRGAVYVDGEDITQMTAEELRQVRLNKMAMVFQHFALFPHKTVCENVEYGLKVQGVGAEERREKALRALAQVGLEAWADRPPASLSGGMQQRVGLARGLAVDPEIMLMDEPFSALDPLIRRDMQGELLQLQRHVARTIVFITHDLNEALILGDRIAIMKEGRFVQTGTPQDIVANPADDYVSAFTQDVDRGRVFTAATVMREPDTVDLAGDDAESALARMRALGRDSLFAVDGGEIAGVIRWRDLVDGGGEQGLRAVMRTDYPTTTADAHLYEIFDRCGSGLPLAVQDRKGAITGVVYPTDVFDVLRVPEESGETARGA